MWVFRLTTFRNYSRKIRKEFDLDLVTTTPNVIYKILDKSGRTIEVDTPAKMPETGDIQAIMEPIVSAEILTPKKYMEEL